jgi:hypothetical protein
MGRLGRQTPALADLLPEVRLDAMDLLRHWATVAHVDGVKRRAERLVGVHPLSAADAMQLGAALLASGDRPKRSVRHAGPPARARRPARGLSRHRGPSPDFT